MTDSALVIRADAGPVMGTGHVMRCLALAAGFRAVVSPTARVRFVSSIPLPGGLAARLTRAGFETTAAGEPPAGASDADRTAALAKESGANVVVVDGYAFDGSFEARLRRHGLRVAAMDDFGHTRHEAEFVINQNLHAEPAAYEPVPPASRLLLGPRYALIRPEFWPYRGRTRDYAPAAGKVLVTLGGADPGHVAPRVLEGLSPLGLEVRVIVGSADPRRDETLDVARSFGFETFMDASDMGEHMMWADFAVASAGVTLLELLCLGTPALLVVSAENQRPGARAADARGLARVLGWHADVTARGVTTAAASLLGDPEARRVLGERGRETVDGFGAERVCRELFDVEGAG